MRACTSDSSLVIHSDLDIAAAVFCISAADYLKQPDLNVPKRVSLEQAHYVQCVPIVEYC